jgi:hypothetical protein
LEGCLTWVCNGDEESTPFKGSSGICGQAAFECEPRSPMSFPSLATSKRCGPHPFPNVMLNEDPLQIYLHHGGNNATYYRFVGDDNHLLLYIEVIVESRSLEWLKLASRAITSPTYSITLRAVRPQHASTILRVRQKKQDALERWARRLQAIVDGKTRKVVPLAR